MADGTRSVPHQLLDSVEGSAVLFALADSRYALPLAAIDAILPPPSLCRVPHAPAPLLGAGNLGGQVLPVIDLGELLPGARPRRRYDGGGEVLRVHAAGGSVGIWVDRVERLVAAGAGVEAAALIDPELLVRAGLAAPSLARDARHPLGDSTEMVARSATPAAEASYYLVEAAGENIRLARESVLVFLEAPPWVAVPAAPPGFLGVGIVFGDALPMLSLASLIGLPEDAPPNNFAIVALANGRRLLLGFNRVIGLRTYRGQTGRRGVDLSVDAIATTDAGRAFDLDAAVAGELRRIVSGFMPAVADGRKADASGAGGAAHYLVFVVGNEHYALSVDTVDRVVPAAKVVALPQALDGRGAITGAIQLRSQLVPVARLADQKGGGEPGAYVILRGAAGQIALGAERVERLIALRPDQIGHVPGALDQFEGVAVLDEAGDLLRLLAPGRIGLDG